MDQKVSKKATALGGNPLTKDRFDVISKVVAIIGGLISAIALIISLQNNTEQRARELRWSQAKLAVELEDDMFINDPQAFNALRMIDWGAYAYTIKGTEVMISREEVQQALNVENNNELTPKSVFVRESFDRLFYRMGKIERAVKSELVRFEDVYSPMDPSKVANSASICSRVNVTAASWALKTFPLASCVSVRIPIRARASYFLGSADRYSANRVTGPTCKMRSPDAKGSSVPVWPILRTPRDLRAHLTTS